MSVVRRLRRAVGDTARAIPLAREASAHVAKRQYEQRVHRFLGVAPVAVSEPARVVNPSGAVRSRALHRFLTQPHPAKDLMRPIVPDRLVQATYRRTLARNLRSLPSMDDDLRWDLAAELRPVARGVHELTGLDTSGWCRPVPGTS